MRNRVQGSSVVKFFATAAAAIAFIGTPPAQGVLLRDGLNGYDGTSDNQLYIVPTSAGSENLNWGAWNQIYGSEATTVQRRSNLAFDLSSLAGEVVQDATLRLTQTFANNIVAAENTDLWLYQILPANAGWVQGNNLATAADAGESTWANKAHPGTAWAGSAGLSTAGVDVSATPIYEGLGVYNFSTTNIGTVFEISLPADLVQSWIDNPSSNAGVQLRSGVAAGNYRYPTGFASSEFVNLNATTGDETWRPTLDITLVPEPGTVGVLAIAGLALAARRRRS
jgi:hypothetical protein